MFKEGEKMKLVHTSYIVTTGLFLLLATFLLTEQPLPKPLTTDKAEMKQQQVVQEENAIEVETSHASHDPFAGLPRVEVVATGYYAGIESTGKSEGHPQYGITYSGAKVVRDHYSTIAADLNLFPLGTILYIPGYGYGVVADIGSAIKGNIIDLYFDTKEDVFAEWGKKTVDVFVVKQGDGTVTDAMMETLNSKQMVQATTQPR